MSPEQKQANQRRAKTLGLAPVKKKGHLQPNRVAYVCPHGIKHYGERHCVICLKDSMV